MWEVAFHRETRILTGGKNGYTNNKIHFLELQKEVPTKEIAFLNCTSAMACLFRIRVTRLVVVRLHQGMII